MGLFEGKRPSDLGVHNGKLKPPPSSPNAVHSQVTQGYWAIAPLTYQTTLEASRSVLLEILRNMPHTRLITQSQDYIYAECETALMGFVDDVEFYWPAERGVIHVRSASRLGRSDFGVNRRRIESIRSELAAKGV